MSIQDLTAQNLTLVFKIGTESVVDENGQFKPEVASLIRTIAELKREGHRVLLASSGAVYEGCVALLGMRNAASEITTDTRTKVTNALAIADVRTKAKYAAIGQPILMGMFNNLLAEHGLIGSQLLLTHNDFDEEGPRHNIRDTLQANLDDPNVLVIVNENDPVSTEELKSSDELERERKQPFTDNDGLAALVARGVGADYLFLVTRYAVHDCDPRQNPGAAHIPVINLRESTESIDLNGKTEGGRGGMKGKIAAARLAAEDGITTCIISAARFNTNEVRTVIDGQFGAGTIVLPLKTRPKASDSTTTSSVCVLAK